MARNFLPRCTALFNRIPIESLRILNSNAMHLGKKFLAAIFSVIVYCLMCIKKRLAWTKTVNNARKFNQQLTMRHFNFQMESKNCFIGASRIWCTGQFCYHLASVSSDIWRTSFLAATGTRFQSKRMFTDFNVDFLLNEQRDFMANVYKIFEEKLPLHQKFELPRCIRTEMFPEIPQPMQ